MEQETGRSFEAISQEKGLFRQVAMELLYRVGGLKREEIGRVMGVGYTSVSQERRRLRARLLEDRGLVKRIEQKCNE
jgi:putative transposase